MTYEERTKRTKEGLMYFNSNYPGGAYYDIEDETYYNHSGQRLRPIEHYQPDEDGCYEPFGDE